MLSKPPGCQARDRLVFCDVGGGYHKKRNRHDRTLVLPVLLKPACCLIDQAAFGAIST